MAYLVPVRLESDPRVSDLPDRVLWYVLALAVAALAWLALKALARRGHLVGLYDILPEERNSRRHRIFDWAAEEKMLVIGQQFPPFPSLGYVTKLEDGWKWQPVE